MGARRHQDSQADPTFRLARTTACLFVVAGVAFPVAWVTVLLDQEAARAAVIPPTAYVTNADPGSVTTISTATGTTGATITGGGLSDSGVINPVSIAITPDGKTAYVAPIDHATNTVETAITSGSYNQLDYPSAIAITPDGKTAYVTNAIDPGSVTPINLATDTVGTVITGGGMDDPGGIVITPDGKTAYVASSDSDGCCGNPSRVTPINLVTD